MFRRRLGLVREWHFLNTAEINAVETYCKIAGEFIASYSGSSWEEDSVMDSTQKEIQEDEEPLEYILRELKSMNMLHR